ncbi:MAG: PilZ domain-containing protein [Pseudomonadota bacterium]
MSNPRRSTWRYERRVPVEYSTGGDWHSGVVRNISLGGVCIESQDRLRYGDRITVRLVVSSQKEPVEIAGQVRWTDLSGFGVQFDGLRARDVWALTRLLEQ